MVLWNIWNLGDRNIWNLGGRNILNLIRLKILALVNWSILKLLSWSVSLLWNNNDLLYVRCNVLLKSRSIYLLRRWSYLLDRLRFWVCGMSRRLGWWFLMTCRIVMGYLLHWVSKWLLNRRICKLMTIASSFLVICSNRIDTLFNLTWN